MTKYNAPVSIQVYLGSGKKGEKIRENLSKEVKKKDISLSEFIVDLMSHSRPDLFKGVEDAK